MPRLRVAVITDTLSPGFFFPLWYKYYAHQVGAESLYVLVPTGMSSTFSNFRLGGIWEHRHAYDDTERTKTLSSAVDFLLTSYEFVIRVDADEFLVPDVRKWKNIGDYFNDSPPCYATAFGLDIIQHPTEADLRLDDMILIEQRRYGYLNASLNKTCVTSTSMRWGNGFHFCSLFPFFQPLLLVHLKRVDAKLQVEWGGSMVTRVEGNTTLSDYYGASIEVVKNYNTAVARRTVMNGWESLFDREFELKFLDKIRFYEPHKIYYGDMFHGDGVVCLPDELRGML